MSLKELFQDIFGSGPNQAAQGQQPPSPPHREPLPPPPGAEPAPRPAGTGTEPMLAQPAQPEYAQAVPPGIPPAPGPGAEDPALAARQHAAAGYQAYAAPAGQPPLASPGARRHAGRQHSNASSLGPVLFAAVVGALSLLAAVVVVASSVNAAEQRLVNPDAEHKPIVAIAQEAEVAYCTKDFKEVLERVLHSCGLATGTERRGCKPADIKTFAAISDSDFNALFHPLQDRGGVLLFDEGKEELDEGAKQLLEKRWFDRKGARYFFVVARASKTGTPLKNRALSHRRANSVLFHLEKVSGESAEELAKKVGLLWLGNEFAQLSEEYCSWPLSRDPSQEKCGEEPINRSAFVSWVDCRL